MKNGHITLTDGERLWLWRRRKGLRQPIVAERFGVCRTTLSRVENGERGFDSLSHRPHGAGGIEPTAPELLRLLRRRSGLELHDLAERLRVSHVTVLKWERLADVRLAGFWAMKDFQK